MLKEGNLTDTIIPRRMCNESKENRVMGCGYFDWFCGDVLNLLIAAAISEERPEEKFTSLYHYLNEEFLIECHKKLPPNKASGTQDNKEATRRELRGEYPRPSQQAREKGASSAAL